MHLSRRHALLGAAAMTIVPELASAQGARFRRAAEYSAERRGVSMLVMRGREILFEEYPNEGAQDAAWELASGTKSFCGVMVAAAVQDRLLALDEACADTITEWRGDSRRARISIRQLLSLCSGLRPAPIGRPPPYAQAIDAPAIADPGEVFAYGPGPYQIFGELMQRKLRAAGRDPDPVAYLHERVLDPERIPVGLWRRGGDGNPLLPQGAALTARAWAEFGRFVLDGGRGRVDRAALDANFTPSSANPGYGLTWWLLRPGVIGPVAGMPIDAPEEITSRFDVRMAAGAGNQRLYLLPDQDLLIVRQASGILAAMLGGGTPYRDGEFLRLALGV